MNITCFGVDQCVLDDAFLGWTGCDFYDVPVFYTMGFVGSATAWPLLDTTAVVSLRMIRSKINDAWEEEYE